MRTDGRLIRHRKGSEEQLLAQPTFTPDSRQVAFKVVSDKDDSHPRAEAIAFYTAQGEMKSLVPVPEIKPGATRPAE